MHTESNATHIESNATHTESNAMHTESNATHTESNAMHTESNVMCTESNAMHTESRPVAILLLSVSRYGTIISVFMCVYLLQIFCRALFRARKLIFLLLNYFAILF